MSEFTQRQIDEIRQVAAAEAAKKTEEGIGLGCCLLFFLASTFACWFPALRRLFDAGCL